MARRIASPPTEMSWDEPRVIAERLAASLEVPLLDGPDESAEGVLLLDEAGLGALSDAALARCSVVIVAGDPSHANGAGLRALRVAVAARPLDVVLTTFATRPRGGATGTATEVPLAIAAPPGDERVRELLAAGPHALTFDRSVDARPTAPTGPAARVCIVSFEASGMTGGGIGTASSALAESLARAGHDVTLLFTGWQDAEDGELNERWRARHTAQRVRLEFLRAPGANTVKNPHYPARAAYEVYRWLCRQDPFDVVHLPENMGHGAYAQAAKQQGWAFAETTFVVGTHGPTRWAAEANRVTLTREEFLVKDGLERLSVAHADVMLGPSRYLHAYLRERGWTLPVRTHVQPYAQPAAVREAAGASADGQPDDQTGGEVVLPDEIVFFGRLETRKGVVTLCDALDLLAEGQAHAHVEVTFLGPIAEVLGLPADAYIAARAAGWPWRWQILSDRDQRAAAEYLRRPGVLAVMPSTVDNAPNTVSEAIALGVPFVAGRTGGTGELIAAEQRDEHMFAGEQGLWPIALHAPVPPIDAQPLAELLTRRLSEPVIRAMTPVDASAVDAAYDRWHRAVAHACGQQSSAPPELALPTLSVCLLFEGDSELLGAQLAALAADRGDDVDVVVADVRTDTADALAAPDALDDESGDPLAPAHAHGVAIVRPTSRGHVGEARNAAVAATRGDLVAIVPSGDVPLAGFAEGLRRAAAATGAAVCTCVVLDAHEQRRPAHQDDPALWAYVPLGGPPLAGLAYPAFAPGPYAIRRDALADLGGYAADAHGDEADHELLNRAAVAGAVLEVVPEPLAAKRRVDRWSAVHATRARVADPPYAADQQLRVARPFAGSDGRASDAIGLLLGARTEGADFERWYEACAEREAELRVWVANLEQTADQLRTERDRRLADVTTLRADVASLQSALAQLQSEFDALPKNARAFAERSVRSRIERLRR